MKANLFEIAEMSQTTATNMLKVLRFVSETNRMTKTLRREALLRKAMEVVDQPELHAIVVAALRN